MVFFGSVAFSLKTSMSNWTLCVKSGTLLIT